MPGRGVESALSFLFFYVAFACVPAQAEIRPADTTESQSVSVVTSATPLEAGIELHEDSMILRITALRDDVVRVRSSGTGVLPEDASWAVLSTARSSATSVIQDADARAVGFHTNKLRVSVDRRTGRMVISDAAGTILQQDAEPMTFDEKGFRLAYAMPKDEHYFGLGDKTGAFDHREAAFRMWNTDAYGWQESTDPLYKSIPFYVTYRAGVSLGVLIDNTWPSSFDFGKTLGDTVQYRSEGGSADFYILYGPSTKEVLKTYAWLTGPTPLPPLWTLGFQQSRYSYMTQARVLDVAERLRKDRIPSDAVYLDIDYQEKNRPFTVNTKTFPDMAEMVKRLHAEKFHVVAITDLHLAYLPGQDYAPFQSGTVDDEFVKKPDGTVYIGKVWPGPSVFPDFTQAKTRVWWGTLYQGLTQMGIDGFWNDMNEPSVFDDLKTMPCSAVHRIDEPGFRKRSATHCEIHNVYGMENSRATFDGQLALKPDVRPFVLTRASYAGGQRYAATWTGDNSATWNHLRLTTSMLKNLGLSGFTLAGADVGGYAGTPTPELLTKWIEIAAFQPIDRDHAEKGTGDHEVWANGPAQEDIRRRFIETRYRLLPYLYTVTEDDTHTGLPLIRPLFLEFPDAAADRHPLDVDLNTSGEFMVGPDLLVAAPAFADKGGDYEATLPSPGWYDFWTGKEVVGQGEQVQAGGLQPESVAGPMLPLVLIHRELASLPVFVRPGTILPMEPLVESTEEQPVGPLTLRVFPGSRCGGKLYQDDGKSFAYKQGAFLRMEVTCESAADRGRVEVRVGKHQGSYPAWWHQVAVEVNGLAGKPVKVTVNGKGAKFAYAENAATILAEDDGEGVEIVVQGAGAENE